MASESAKLFADVVSSIALECSSAHTIPEALKVVLNQAATLLHPTSRASMFIVDPKTQKIELALATLVQVSFCA